MEKNSIKDLILSMKQRPLMYVPNDIDCLKSYLDGWVHRDSTLVSDFEIMESFQKWIQKRYSIRTSHSWASIIRFYSSDSCNSIDVFFKEFDVFLKEYPL